MGERKGQNLYYPPDYDPRAGGLNAWLGTHALRERARKRHLGILIVRFEMPFNIWCDGCKNHIGMGVRYNAEKKKVGDYYTTPVYCFRMKCHLCDNHIEIQTDPGALEYKVVSGARRQENRWDPVANQQVVPETVATQRRLADDAMFRLEHASADSTTGTKRAPQLAALTRRNNSLWQDDYSANAALRQRLRKSREEAESKKEPQDVARAPPNVRRVALKRKLAPLPRVARDLGIKPPANSAASHRVAGRAGDETTPACVAATGRLVADYVSSDSGDDNQS